MNAEMSDAEKARAEREARESARSRASARNVQQLAERAIRNYLLAQERRQAEKHAGEEETAKETDVHRSSRAQGKPAADEE